MKALFIFCIVLVHIPVLFAQKIIVGKGNTFTTITHAISQANPGDTVWVKPGTYKEGNIIIDKSLVFIGEGYPTLDGQHKFEILTINANDVTVSGFEFIETGTAGMYDIAAVKVLDSKRVLITGNKFVNSFFGILLSNTSHSRIENNQLNSDATAEHEIGNGIHLWKCDQVTIDRNTIKGHRDGIYFEFVTNSFITHNHSEGNIRYGLHFMFSHNDEYRSNAFVNNGAGVSVMYSKGVKMIDNTFIRNWGSASYGMLLKDIRDSFVTGNKFIENSTGIYMEGSSRIHFEKNTFSGNGYAVRLQASCDDNVFTKNNFTANTFDIATNGSLVLNNINNNYWDRYEGYDLDKNSVGDIPYHPVSLYSMMVERMPVAVLLWRSFLVMLMDKAEKAIPAITPENLKDDSPSMKPYDFNKTDH